MRGGVSVLVFCLLASAPVQAHEEGAPQEAPDLCEPGWWKLTGAALQSSGGKDATFAAHWEQAIAKIGKCAHRPEMRPTCLVVQGHYDPEVFPEAVAARYGSPEAAQVARAQARAARVKARLLEEGIADSRLLERAPPPEPSFRGAMVWLSPECVAGAAPDEAGSVGAASGYGSGGAKTRSKHGDEALWVAAGFEGLGLMVEGDDPLRARLRLGVGWRSEQLYLRFGAGPSFSPTRSQRWGLELELGAGWVPRRWLHVGAFGGYRISSNSPSQPWAEQAWSIGIESAQCLGLSDGGLYLCATEAVAPAGNLLSRTIEVDNQLIFGPEHEQSVLQLSLGIVLRQEL
jgi:hypothetical protein